MISYSRLKKKIELYCLFMFFMFKLAIDFLMLYLAMSLFGKRGGFKIEHFEIASKGKQINEEI